MDECYKEYLTSTFVFLNYIVDIDKPNEYAREIINKEYITGSKVAILANILLSIKESVVEKEQSNGINFLSKIFDSALDEATNVIVSNKQDNTYVLNSYKDTPSNILATIRNKFAHGKYLIDFKNNKILINVAKKKEKEVFYQIDVDKLTEYIRKNVKGYLQERKTNEYKRHLVAFSNKNNNKPITLKSEAKNVLKRASYQEFILTSDNEIEEDVLKSFNNIFEIYRETLNIKIMNNFEEKVKKLGYKIISKTKKVNEIEIDNIIANTSFLTYDSKNLSYHNQIANLEEYLLYYFNKDEEKLKQLIANLTSLQILEGIDTCKTTNIKVISKNLIIKRDQELILSAMLAMFNSLFIYPMDNIFLNDKEFTSEENTGFPYELLDISLLKKCDYHLDNNNISNIKEQERSLLKKITKINTDISTISHNLNNIPKEKQKIITKLETTLQESKLNLKESNEELVVVQKELQEKENYFSNNQIYLTNKSIIEGIRNSICHGNIKTRLNGSMDNTIVIFEDIHEDKLTFKLEITLNDLYKFLTENFFIVVEYLKTLEKDKRNVL